MLPIRYFFLLSYVACSSASFAQPQCTTQRDLTRADRIVGGRPALLENWPGQAALRLRGPERAEYICGGTLIAPNVVLTAAHCVNALSEGDGGWHDPQDRVAEIVLGTADLRSVGPDNAYQVGHVIIHEQYEPSSQHNDIALIQLQRPARARTVRLSMMGRADPNLTSLTPVMVAGFGVQSDGGMVKQFQENNGLSFLTGAARLLETTVPLADPKVCTSRYGRERIREQQICAGFVDGGKDSCQGDSGGPLVAFDRQGCPYQIGVVSWGADCAQPNAYGVYARVSAYADWIRQHVPQAVAVDERDVPVIAADTNQLVETVFAALSRELAGTEGKASIDIVEGRRLQLGMKLRLLVNSTVGGNVIIIDINAAGEVAQLFPNPFAPPVRIRAGEEVSLPNSSYVFPVMEPLGRSKLVLLIVPDTFNITALNESKGADAMKGIGVQAALPYFQNLLRLIQIARGTVAKGVGVQATASTQEPGGWGLGLVDYEVVR